MRCNVLRLFHPARRCARPRAIQKTVTRRRAAAGGFLLVEVLISTMILTSGIAATMYLYRVGYESLERVRQSNLVSSKVPYAVNFLQTDGYAAGNGSEELGDGVVLTWKSRIADRRQPASVEKKKTGKPVDPNDFFSAMGYVDDGAPKTSLPEYFTMLLYKVEFTVSYMELRRDYELEVVQFIRHKRIVIFGQEI